MRCKLSLCFLLLLACSNINKCCHFCFTFCLLDSFSHFLIFFFGLPALGRFAARWFKNSCSTDEIMYTTPCPPNFCPLKVFFFFGSGTGLEPIFTLMARQLSNKNKNRAAPITRIGDLDPDLDVDADNLAAACGNQESLAVSRQHFKNAKWLKAKLAESSGAILYTFSQRIVFVCWLLCVWVTLII